MIGALAAASLIVTGNDGRIVQMGDWPDDLEGRCSVESIAARNVAVVDAETNVEIGDEFVDAGKHMRPNLHNHRFVVFVRPSSPSDCNWETIKLV